MKAGPKTRPEEPTNHSCRNVRTAVSLSQILSRLFWAKLTPPEDEISSFSETTS